MDKSQSPANSLKQTQVLQSCCEQVMKWSKKQLDDYFDAVDEYLFQLSSKSKNNAEQSVYFQSRDEFRNARIAISQQFIRSLDKAFNNYRLNKNTNTDFNSDIDPSQESKLALVDQEKLEEALAISSMSRKANTTFSEALFALNHRFSALVGGKKISEQCNPIAPGVFAEGLQFSLQGLLLDNQAKLVVYKIFEQRFTNHLNQLYNQINEYFKEQNILPHLNYSISKNAQQAQPTTTASTTPTTQELAEEALSPQSLETINHQMRLMEAIRILQARIAQSQPVRRAPIVNAIPIAQLITNIKNFQKNAHSHLQSLESPQAVADSNAVTFKLQAEQEARKTKDVDENTIEIVGLLFEYMLNDQQLPDSVKTLLSYLHTPFLKVALLDKDFFNQPEHPSRQLLNNLVASGGRWVEPAGQHKNDVFQHIKKIVEKLLSDFSDDLQIFTDLDTEFKEYLKQHTRRIRLAEKRSTQAAQGENKLKEIRLKVESYLKSKIGAIQLTSPIKTLLFEPWANFLSFNLLRFGSRSENWREAAQAVDDILWYCQAHDIATDMHARKRIQELRTTLPKILQHGFDTVGYDDSQGQRLLTTLINRQQYVDDKQSIKPITPAITDIDNVKINQKAQAALQKDSIIKKLTTVEFGTWFAFNANDKNSQHAKLAWSNANTLHFMFVNKMGQQVAIKTGQQLADEIRNGETKLLKKHDDKPFFETAMEQVIEQLQQKEKTVSQ